MQNNSLVQVNEPAFASDFFDLVCYVPLTTALTQVNTAVADTVDSDDRGDDSHCAKVEANADAGVNRRKCVPI